MSQFNSRLLLSQAYGFDQQTRRRNQRRLNFESEILNERETIGGMSELQYDK